MSPVMRVILRFVCVGYLLLFVFSEGYSAAATALDHHSRFPAWESTLGLFLFILPCELLVSMALVLYGDKTRLGVCLIAVNLCAYLGFICLEDMLVPEARDWEFTAIRATFMALAVGAAHFLRTSSHSLRA